MQVAHLKDAVESLEKANADLEPELLVAEDAHSLLEGYARAERLAAFGKAMLARRLQDADELARVSGTSVVKARATVETAKALGEADQTREALKGGDISFDQAAEIARAEVVSPQAAKALLAIAENESFKVLQERSRKVVLEAEQHRGLGERQRKARSGRNHSDELGMVHVHLAWEPHVGIPIVARAEAEAQRLARAAKAEGKLEPFDRHLADAYARMLAGKGKGRARRPELVVLVSHEVAKRGWTDVKDGEVCKIPGVGPVPPEIAKEIARDAFLNGLFYDGTDLRHFKRYTKHIPVEIAVALELGDPPDLDGVACVDCGNRFRTEFDHVRPRAAKGPTSRPNLNPRCWDCHHAKSEEDRQTGKFKPPEP